MGVATGIFASAVVGGVSSYMGGKEEASANKKAGETSFLMAMEAMKFQDEAMGDISELQEPWRVAGEQALQRIIDQPDFSFTPEEFDFMADPSYDWRVSQGVNALDQSASSRGNLLSGAQSKALTEYGQDMGSQEYQNSWDRFMTEEQFRYNTEVGEFGINQGTDMAIMGAGQNATNLLSQATQNTANNKANFLLGGTAGYNQGMVNSAEASSDAMTGVATSINTGVSNYLIDDRTQALK